MTDEEMAEERVKAGKPKWHKVADNVFERINVHWTSVRGKKQ